MPELEPVPEVPDAPSGEPDDAGDSELLLVPARFNERLIAYLIDGAPLMAGYILTIVYGLPRLGGSAAARPAMWFWLGAYVAYQFFGNLKGATFGKRLMGLRVVRKDGEPLGAARAAVRAAGHLISTPLCNFGFLLTLLHPESRALHDLLAGTLVVEPERKHPAEATLLFLAAALTLSVLYGTIFYLHLGGATPQDLERVAKAREGLGVLAQIEEVYKQGHSYYTDDLAELAQASGDADQFRDAMLELFEPHGFRIQASRDRYRLSAVALDRKRTRVMLEGPAVTSPAPAR